MTSTPSTVNQLTKEERIHKIAVDYAKTDGEVPMLEEEISDEIARAVEEERKEIAQRIESLYRSAGVMRFEVMKNDVLLVLHSPDKE